MLKRYINISNRIAKSRKGASMIEYALVLAVIAAVAIAVFQNLGDQVNTSAQAALDGFQAAGAGS